MNKPRISIEWEQTIAEGELFRKRYDHTERIFNGIHGAAVRRLSAEDISLGLSRWAPNRVQDFVYGQTVDAATLVLFGSAIRGAKERVDHRTTLTPEEWTDLAFAQRDLDPNGHEPHGSRGYFERCAEYSNDEPDEQRRVLGAVALTIAEGDFFVQRQEIAFRGELVVAETIQG